MRHDAPRVGKKNSGFIPRHAARSNHSGRFGIVCFRARPAHVDPADLDALNERVLARVVGEGRYFISSTRLRGAFSLRACILGFRTAEEDIDGLVRAVADAAHDLHAAGSAHPTRVAT